MSPGPTTQSLDERIDTLSDDMKELTKTVRDAANDLVWVKRIGAFVVAFLITAVATSGRVIWDASALNSEVKQQGARLDKIEGRLDVISKQLETLISRSAPKEAAGG